MARLSTLAAALALISFTNAADCGAAYTDYFAAINAALGTVASGERVAVMASGSIGTNIISIDSGKIFEGCCTIDLGYKAGRGGIESLNTKGVSIP
ncbi:hypothetical protein VC83_01001 [Pseudogymnoascus destructans]|uniref:Pectate lyase n=2 Tax=Pseudogymnoascus destructans TaxID=655981 RepID=L8FLK0_PSED2|nr:uncharacterized protein VC83_01001 [Pseudogymnoascus destructans]ELR01770.1 hypothetical protein GMDG_00146 [Pseudogymnoascus destructans 20631-21]OAF62507.1 hypothetical protein VC83_01001 [Pseudogymnoascus destructans]